jgi:DNA helicase II / ATP-dependent DNA helicase PcrA
MTLDVNYRSPANIVEAAAKLIKTNEKRLDKTTRAAKSDTGVIRLLARTGDEDVVNATVSEAMSHRPEDVTIMVRTNAQAEKIAHAITQAGAAVYRFNPESDISPELKGYLAWLKLVANMNDNGAALRLIGEAASSEAARGLMRQATLMKQSIFQYIDNRRANAQTLSPAIEKLAETRRRIRDSIDFMSTTEILDAVLIETGIASKIEDLRPGPKTRFLRQHMALKRMAEKEDNLAILVSAAQIDMVDNDARPTASIAVSTMHGMKGLETPIVIAPFWSAGDFPSRQDKGDTADESVRLAFVTITRATKSFIAIYDVVKGPSPYLSAMGALEG